MRSRFPLLLLALTIAAPLLAGTGSAPATVADVATERAWVRFVFDPALLASFGFEIDPAVDRLELEAVAPSSFVVDAADADFEGITSGSLRFVGGFTLTLAGRSVPFVGIEIVPGSNPLSLDLLDGRGRKLLHGDQMHFSYNSKSGRLGLQNVDVHLTPDLAAELGAPELAGISIARLELEATTRASRSPAPEGTLDCSPQVWTGVVDVSLTTLTMIQQADRNAGKVAISVATGLQSGGTADVPWYRKFIPCTNQTTCGPYYNTDQHPYLVWALYRIAPLSGDPGAPTSMRMLAKSGLKHAFFATNTGCHCGGGQTLWAPSGIGNHDTVPCADVYGNTNNNDPNALGPREELEAHTGLWVSTGSFFDPDANGICDSGGPNGPDCDGSVPFTSITDRRLAVDETELSTPAATYLIDGWYIVRGDVDIFNTMGWKPIVPTLGSSWTFPFNPSNVALALGSVLDAWVSHIAPPAGASHERIDTGIGHLSLAAKTTDLGAGQFHYEYALANHDFDRKVQSFRVPVAPGTTVSNAVFRGLVNGGGSDWTITVAADAITFQAPADANVNALEWGTLFSFGFDADAAPAAGSTDLGALEETPTLFFAAPAMTPGGALGSAIFFDDFESGGSARWSSTTP